MTHILKFWHQWSWAITCLGYIIMLTAIVVGYRDTLATNTKDIAELQQAHKDENMAVRMAKQEQATQDIGQNLQEIKAVQGKIFDRINQIVDRNNGR